jgi:carboxypeptidase C (cathepsin A)
MKNFISLSILFLSFLCLNNVLFAQNGIKDTISTSKELKSVTHHKVIIGGKTIQYTATAGALILRNSQDEPIAF